MKNREVKRPRTANNAKVHIESVIFNYNYIYTIDTESYEHFILKMEK